MIYLFSGEDADSRGKAYRGFIKTLPKSVPVFFIERDNFDKSQVESFYSGSGLFFSESAVVFSNILEREDTREFILEKLEELADSRSKFIFLEGKLAKPILDAFKKARAELNIFEKIKEKKEAFNNFLLANALGERDKLNLWIYFRQAVGRGVGLEELVGVLFWKAKDMLLKKNFRKFSLPELQNFTSQISFILPKARGRGEDDEATLEHFLLEVV